MLLQKKVLSPEVQENRTDLILLRSHCLSMQNKAPSRELIGPIAALLAELSLAREGQLSTEQDTALARFQTRLENLQRESEQVKENKNK